MNKQTENLLQEWAITYNNKSFIKDDPIQFPHLYTSKCDIEVSAFITAWLSFGRRTHILKKANELHSVMKNGPYAWIMSDEDDKKADLLNIRSANEGKRDTCYRFYTFQDYLDLCMRLKEVYKKYDSLENALPEAEGGNPIEKLQHLFKGINGIPTLNGNSACKRLAMFLRWMVRQDGIVDFGIWRTHITPKELIIPLDTHVFQISRELGLTSRNNATLKTAIEITEALKTVFPDDPCLGDFSLFGYDINKI
jgi:TIGR02757 family protein